MSVCFIAYIKSTWNISDSSLDIDLVRLSYVTKNSWWCMVYIYMRCSKCETLHAWGKHCFKINSDRSVYALNNIESTAMSICSMRNTTVNSIIFPSMSFHVLVCSIYLCDCHLSVPLTCAQHCWYDQGYYGACGVRNNNLYDIESDVHINIKQ